MDDPDQQMRQEEHRDTGRKRKAIMWAALVIAAVVAVGAVFLERAREERRQALMAERTERAIKMGPAAEALAQALEKMELDERRRAFGRQNPADDSAPSAVTPVERAALPQGEAAAEGRPSSPPAPSTSHPLSAPTGKNGVASKSGASHSPQAEGSGPNPNNVGSAREEVFATAGIVAPPAFVALTMIALTVGLLAGKAGAIGAATFWNQVQEYLANDNGSEVEREAKWV